MYSGMGFVEKTREGRKKSRIMMKLSLRPHLDLRAGMHPGRAVLGPVVRLVLVDLDLDLGRLGRLGRGGGGAHGGRKTEKSGSNPVVAPDRKSNLSSGSRSSMLCSSSWRAEAKAEGAPSTPHETPFPGAEEVKVVLVQVFVSISGAVPVGNLDVVDIGWDLDSPRIPARSERCEDSLWKESIHEGRSEVPRVGGNWGT